MAAEGSCAAPRAPPPPVRPGQPWHQEQAPSWAATLTSPLFWQLPFQDSPKQ